MNTQQELFSEFPDREGRKKIFNKGLFPDRALTVSLTYEKLILAALGAVVILSAIFVFGFECGKKTAAPKQAPAVFVKEQPVVVKKEVIAAPVKAVTKESQVVKRKVAAKPVPRPYTIQVASFKSQQYAQEEMAKLKNRGVPAAMIFVNGIYEVLAGEYSDRAEASQALSTFNKNYKGCIIRKR